MLFRPARVCCLLYLGFLLCAPVVSVFATPDNKFDNVTFCCPGSIDDHLCQAHFDELNIPTITGHYIAMGTDAHRLELATNGNALAIYFNTFNEGWTTNTGAMSASNINQYALANFTSTGPRPDWIVLNEISSGLWTSDSSYRAWVRAAVHSLKSDYGFNVILFSPFPNPGANNADWQAVAGDAFIGIENYLSGAEVKSQGYSVSYCQSQYQSSITSYNSLGVNPARLMLGEHFAQTTSGNTFGRSGIASNEWDTVITARNQAALNAGFAGFLSYAWSKNGMLVSDQEMLHFEDTYRTNQLPVNSGVTAPFAVSTANAEPNDSQRRQRFTACLPRGHGVHELSMAFQRDQSSRCNRLGVKSEQPAGHQHGKL